MDKDWDVDDYKTDHESEEHWELRKKFMLAHKNNFSEEEVVCYAQVFANIEFMGCRYPDETMVRVAELTKGVVEDYREKKKNCLKRTFVAASEAAGAKVKGLKGVGDPNIKKPEKMKFLKEKTNSAIKKSNSEISIVTIDEDSNSGLNENSSFISTSPHNNNNKRLKSNEVEVEQMNKVNTMLPNPFYTGTGCIKNEEVETCSINSRTELVSKVKIKPVDAPFSDIVIFTDGFEEENPTNLMYKIGAANKYALTWELFPTDDQQKCAEIYLNNVMMTSAVGSTTKEAKEIASRKCINKLREICYSVKVKAKFFSNTSVTKSMTKNTSTVECEEQPEARQQVQLVDGDNVGAKIMKLMGWSGGGLGSQEQGITEPVSVDLKVNRSGLGVVQNVKLPGKKGKDKKRKGKPSKLTNLQDLENFRNAVRKNIEEWKNSNTDDDLVFSTEFSNEERKIMHELGLSMGVKTKSYGKGMNRNLVMTKKTSSWEIVEELAQIGGTSDKYELIYPTCLTK